MSTLDIYLASGQTITLVVADWSLKRLAGEVTSFTWTDADGKPSLRQIDISKIVAVVSR